MERPTCQRHRSWLKHGLHISSTHRRREKFTVPLSLKSSESTSDERSEKRVGDDGDGDGDSDGDGDGDDDDDDDDATMTTTFVRRFFTF